MIAVDVFGLSINGDTWNAEPRFEIDAQVTFYVNNEVIGQFRGDFIIKSDKSLSFDDAAEAIKEMFRRSME
jgi:hypothetical protein